jgi:hypothetical protein
MAEEFEVHGQHDHAVEHAAHVDSLGRWVAMFTAALTVLTRQRWMLLFSGACTLTGIGFWIGAWL